MNLILTMAGKYSRFVAEGYKIPKYLLPWGNRSILCEIILNLNEKNIFKNIYLFANKQDEMYMPHVKQIMKSLGIPISHLFLIEDTLGQAHTAKVAIDLLSTHIGLTGEGIVFHNIDTILYKRDMVKLRDELTGCDGIIDVFDSSNHNYSYVLADEEGRVTSIAEKMVISNKASSGLYAFAKIQLFLDNYTQKDLYISSVYKNMIANNKKICISKTHNERDTIVLGTPSNYLSSTYILDL